jgi:hypothetical protein
MAFASAYVNTLMFGIDIANLKQELYTIHNLLPACSSSLQPAIPPDSLKLVGEFNVNTEPSLKSKVSFNVF